MKPATTTKALSRHITGPFARDRDRQAARWLAAIWLSFLLLNYLQPCCEVVTAAVPHGHGGAWTNFAATNTDGHAHLGHDHAGQDHKHCATSDGIDTAVPDFLTSSFSSADIQFVFVGLVLTLLYSLASLVPVRVVNDRERGPPHRVYLTTLRLRI